MYVQKDSLLVRKCVFLDEMGRMDKNMTGIFVVQNGRDSFWVITIVITIIYMCVLCAV